MLGDFIALTPQRACPELNSLAAAFVEGLDRLRAVQARDAAKWPPAKLSSRPLAPRANPELFGPTAWW